MGEGGVVKSSFPEVRSQKSEVVNIFHFFVLPSYLVVLTSYLKSSQLPDYNHQIRDKSEENFKVFSMIGVNLNKPVFHPARCNAKNVNTFASNSSCDKKKMENTPFIEKSTYPSDEKLKDVLQSAYSFYSALLAQTRSFRHEWNFYKSSGWIEKVSDKKKALYYCIPLENAFKISLTLRESEKETMIRNSDLNAYHLMINEAKKYSEGYNLQFLIKDKESYNFFYNFIIELISLR